MRSATRPRIGAPLAAAVLALLAAAAAAPWRFGGGGALPTLSLLDVALGLALAATVAMALVDEVVVAGPRAVLALLLVAPAVALSSGLWAGDVAVATRSALLAVETVLAYLVGVNLAWRVGERAVARLVVVFVLGCFVVSGLFYLRVPGFGLYVPPGGATDVARLVSAFTRFSHPFIGLSNDYAPILGAAALVGAGLVHAGGRALRLAVFLASCGVLLTLSRGAIAAFAVAGLAHVVLARVRWRTLLVGGGAMALLALAGAAAVSRFEVRVGSVTFTGAELVADRFRSTSNVAGRLERFEATWAEASRRPVLGAGAGALDPSGTGALADASHNTVLEQLLFFGGVLGTLVAAAWVLLPAALWRALRAPGESDPGAARARAALAAAALFLVLASLTQTFLEATVPRVLVHLLLGLGVGALLSRRAAPEAP